jgi:hypothetical protein
MTGIRNAPNLVFERERERETAYGKPPVRRPRR